MYLVYAQLATELERLFERCSAGDYADAVRLITEDDARLPVPAAATSSKPVRVFRLCCP
jgi:hypothetical protein